MNDVLDTDAELDAPATAADVVAALEVLQHAWRHDPGARDRARRLAKLLQPVVTRLLRPKYVFSIEADGRVLVGLLGEARLYSNPPRGALLAHRVLAENRGLITYTELGEQSRNAAAMALTRARAWLAERCPPLARALGTIECADDGVRLDRQDLDIEIVAQV